MRRSLVLALGALAILGSVLPLRIVLHLYTDHGHLDLFHLLVGIGSALAGLLFVWRAGPGRAA